MTVILDQPDWDSLLQSESLSTTRGTPQTGLVGKIYVWDLIWFARDIDTIIEKTWRHYYHHDIQH